jgi:hypothetical protein
MAAGACGEAEKAFRSALQISPDLAEAHANLALLLDARRAWDEAERHYMHSIALNPDYSQTHSNLGSLLAGRKRFAEAEVEHRYAVAIAPGSPAAWSNLGVLLACLKREGEAEQCYRTAIGLDPGYANARFNLSYVLLRQGRYREGWASYEARPWAQADLTNIGCPRWHGESLEGKSVLVWYEAGHGDMIQFCRYLPLLKTLGASRVTLVCHPALRLLVETLAGVDALFAADQHIPNEGYDYWTYPLSLPHFCQTELASIPAATPYLHAMPGRMARWAARLATDGFRVGLVWKGSPAHENDADRSLPSLEALAPLWTVPGIRFVSLQKGAGEDETRFPPPGLSLVSLGSEMADFADVAAIVAQLDLVICVDTAVAHLAGALNRPCWVLLADYKTDWRWLTGRADSPWYPTIRLFRQARGGDWASVIEEIRIALAAQINDRSRLGIHRP